MRFSHSEFSIITFGPRRRCTHLDELFMLPIGSKLCRIRSVAIESTGVYWIPLYQVLADAGMELCPVNARHLQRVPGRKSDVCDAEYAQGPGSQAGGSWRGGNRNRAPK